MIIKYKFRYNKSFKMPRHLLQNDMAFVVHRHNVTSTDITFFLHWFYIILKIDPHTSCVVVATYLVIHTGM